MRKLISYGAFIGIGVAALTFLGSLLLAKDLNREFWSSFLLNLSAELLGLGLAILIASIVARKKLDDLAPHILNLIARLTHDKKIEGETARGLVICAVKVLSEDRLRRTPRLLSILTQEQRCGVCLLNAETKPGPKGFAECVHCELESDVWKNPGG